MSYYARETETYPNYAALPSEGERTVAMLAHISSLLAAWFAMGFMGPLVTYLVSRPGSFARRHSAESLNFQITLLILTAIATIFSIFTLGLGLLVVIPVALAVMLLALFWIIQGTLAGRDGRDFRYPINIRIFH